MRKLHNPKSHAPAVYIPCWLIQVPNKLLSYAAKILYGRLAQWSSENGDVYRSYNQLSQEIGSSQRSINEYLRELRECGLIDTLQPQAGGLNHFVFFAHHWMHEPITEFLSYKPEPDNTPSRILLDPQAESCSTPKQNPARINKKEIKENNNINQLVKNDDVLIVDPSYEYPDTLYREEKKTDKSLSIQVIQSTNTHDIPIQMIRDWITNRKAKRSPVTQTAWNRLNKQLSKCPSPLEAFEEMVARGWQSINPEWLEEVKNRGNNLNHDTFGYLSGIEDDLL